eukprot:13498544-Alexandrium_andersonii.AAC.1
MGSSKWVAAFPAASCAFPGAAAPQTPGCSRGGLPGPPPSKKRLQRAPEALFLGGGAGGAVAPPRSSGTVSYTHLRAHETSAHL